MQGFQLSIRPNLQAIRGCATGFVMLTAITVGWVSQTFAEESSALDTLSTHAADSRVRVDHDPFERVLKLISVEHQSRELVAYSRLTGRVLDYMNAYVELLKTVPVTTLNPDEQLAYWLNLHNVLVLKLIAENRNGYKKINRYRGTPDDPGDEWLRDIVEVQGVNLSLHTIEQEILFGFWQDPLVMYGISYGVQGSPGLRGGAYVGATVHQQLEARAKKFVNSKKHVKVKRNGLELSSIYEWHKPRLFSNDDEQVLAHLALYADAALKQDIEANPQIKKYRFSWRSNAFIPRAAPTSLGGGAGRGAGS